jgi:hypothetical protein
MKILELEDNSNWSYEHKCGMCNTKLQVIEGDIIYKRFPRDISEPAMLSPESYDSKCCVCDTTFSIDYTFIPKLMQVQFRQKYNK